MSRWDAGVPETPTASAPEETAPPTTTERGKNIGETDRATQRQKTLGKTGESWRTHDSCPGDSGSVCPLCVQR